MAKAEKFYRIEFKVTGNGEFPYDMLRYDRCYPKDSVANLSSPVGNRQATREVTLIRYSPINLPGGAPTEERWLSFGWAVVKGSVGFL